MDEQVKRRADSERDILNEESVSPNAIEHLVTAPKCRGVWRNLQANGLSLVPFAEAFHQQQSPSGPTLAKTEEAKQVQRLIASLDYRPKKGH
jgi:hypothetical protein